MLHLLDTAQRQGDAGAQAAARASVGALDWHENGRDLGLSLSSARSPADVYSLDVATGKVERWTESETGGLERRRASPSPSSCAGRASTAARSRASSTSPPARFTGQAAGHHQHPRRARGPVPPGLPRAAATTSSNELGVACSSRTCAARRATARPSCKLDNGVLREDSVKDIGALLDWIAHAPGPRRRRA